MVNQRALIQIRITRKYDTFWQIVDGASAKSNGEIGLKKEILEKKINKLECSDVADFVFWNWRYQGALCSPPMLAAICLLLKEELTDNSFPEFQNAIIGQGKEFYLKALSDPETLENHRNILLGSFEPHSIAKDIYYERCGGGNPGMSLTEKAAQRGIETATESEITYRGATGFEIATKFGKILCPRLWEKYGRLLHAD